MDGRWGGACFIDQSFSWVMGGGVGWCGVIEEGFIQKTRQTVVVSVWGARSCAAQGIFGLNVLYPLLLLLGGGGGGFL